VEFDAWPYIFKALLVQLDLLNTRNSFNHRYGMYGEFVNFKNNSALVNRDLSGAKIKRFIA